MVYFQKSQPAPPCLEIEKAKNGDYNCEGVLEKLQNDFKNKCYLCEYKEPHSINTEHLISHHQGRYIDLKFDWNNLFFCCEHCNKTKGTRYDNILNCTDENDDVDKKIKYWIEALPKEKAVITSNVDIVNDKIDNTVLLLMNVYNGTTEMKQMESANLRNKLLKEIISFRQLLFDYDESKTMELKDFYRMKIKAELDITSNFTAFKRWIIIESDYFVREFGMYI
jgi:hypothetical protein